MSEISPEAAALVADGDRAVDEKNFEDAERAYRRVTALVPSNARLALKLGIVLDCLKRHDDALQWVKRAIALEPSNVEALLGYTKCCHRRGDAVEMRSAAERIIAIEPHNAYAYHALGNALFQNL